MEADYPTPDLTAIAGQRVTVMGLGNFGGGAAAVRFLIERGATVRVSDQRPKEQLGPTLAQLGDLTDIDWQLGEHRWSHFSDADFVVANPAVPPHHSIIQQVEAARTPLTSEMNLFWSCNPGRVIAVTGSNGKSTTTALIHSILSASGHRCWLGGNIGRSLLPHIGEIMPDDWVVLELSSFQLHLLDRIKARPDIAVVTNFAPNHLDWHGTLDEYRRAKQTILRWQTGNDLCVLNGSDSDVASWPRKARATLVTDPLTGDNAELPISNWCHLPGRHNYLNALLSVTAARLAGADNKAVQIGLESFKALPHRLEFVGEFSGRRFYNDSISTTPESTIAALDSFEAPVVILAGGYDKQIDLTSMSSHIAERAKAASLLGQTAPALKSQIEAINPDLPTATCSDFESAFQWTIDQSSPGDIILLSPGCASYDWFQSFVDRGEQFGCLITSLKRQP